MDDRGENVDAKILNVYERYRDAQDRRMIEALQKLKRECNWVVFDAFLCGVILGFLFGFVVALILTSHRP